MSNITTRLEKINHLKVFTVTFNMGGKTPTFEDIDRLLMKDSILHDVYVFASQEALTSIAKSICNPDKSTLDQML